MGKLWMVFKKYGTVFDMFMVQRRLRNGKRYGFVRFKLVKDVEGLLRQLQKIKIGDELLRVYEAFDRKNKVNGEMRGDGGVHVNSGKFVGSNGRDGTVVKRDICDNRKYVDVINGGSKKAETNGYGKSENATANVTEQQKDNNGDMEIPLGGLTNIEIKLLGGLEVLVVFENEATANNVLKDTEHGLRRWIHKVRRGDSLERTAGRFTWINIMGVPISCWGEATFRRIAALHGTILGFHNCRLEGNQSVTYGRVQIHTINKGLIKENLTVRVKRKGYKVSVVEEMRDIIEMDMHETVKRNQDGLEENEEENKMEDIDMNIGEDDDGGDEGNNSDSGESSDEEGGEEDHVFEKRGGGGHSSRLDSGRQIIEEDVESRCSGETKVRDSFKDESETSKKAAAAECKEKVYRETTKVDIQNNHVGGGPTEKVLQECGTGYVNETCEGTRCGIAGNKILGLDVGLDKCGTDNTQQKKHDGLTNNQGERAGVRVRKESVDENNSLHKRINNSSHKCINSGCDDALKEITDVDYENSTVRRDKREVSPSSSVGSGGDRLRKKRKSLNDEVFGGDEVVKVFNKGKLNEGSINNKKKVGRKSVTKAMEVARRIGVHGLGENKKGVSDIYKDDYEEGDKKDIF
ncbi:hypothetical protein CTI12_AA631290 [Artemisia annua]|uniref:RRM domain-containing protein n=1 Tax=Artemisia annua TaxID=35608 RepID=A0A2U1K8U9_ARTAN|nr:hypothetical protein CTI12_AA631290 [Artemisia annua]